MGSERVRISKEDGTVPLYWGLDFLCLELNMGMHF